MALDFYKIPGINTVCLIGGFGVGKTLSLVEEAIKAANYLDLDIVINFPIDRFAYYHFCRKYGYKNALKKSIYYVSSFVEYFDYTNAVYVCDEAPLYLFSRDFNKTNKDIFIKLFQLRKRKSVLFYSAQSFNQLDKQLRDVTAYFVHCTADQKFSPVHKATRLRSMTAYCFSREAYDKFLSDPDLALKWFYPIYLSNFRFSKSNLYFSRLTSRIIAFLKFIFTIENYRGIPFNAKFYPLVFYLKRLFNFQYRYGFSKEDLIFSIYDSYGYVSVNSSSNVRTPKPLINNLDLNQCLIKRPPNFQQNQ